MSKYFKQGLLGQFAVISNQRMKCNGFERKSNLYKHNS
jgi:hypothetical protein